MHKHKMSNIERHSAGAIITHNSKFKNLVAYSNEADLTQDFLEEWTIPFYMDLKRKDEDWIQKISDLYHGISDEIILYNLGDFNWRTRQTGAFFSSVKKKLEFIDIIGIHLLKSEVCIAGSEYAVTLAFFNNPKSVNYLTEYLDYYLEKPELQFDQGAVITAIKFLDKVNETSLIERYLKRWETCLKGCQANSRKRMEALKAMPHLPKEAREKLDEVKFPEINPEIDTESFEKRVEVIKKIRTKANQS